MKKKEGNIKGISLFITYAGISIILLFMLFVFYALNQLRFEKGEMYGLIRHQSEALIQSMETAWQNAIDSDSLIRSLVAERLLDNAYLIDQLMALSFDNPIFLKQLVSDTHIFRVIITDSLGRPILDSQAPLSSPTLPAVPRLPYDQTEILKMVNSIIFGQKERLLVGLEPKNPFKEDLLWVAVARRGKPGAIIIVVQSDYINRFRSKIGLTKILEEIGSKPGIEYLIYEDNYNKISVQKDISGSTIITKSFHSLRKTQDTKSYEFTRSSPSNKEVLELRHPFSFRDKNIGTIRIGLPLQKLRETEKSMRSKTLLFGSLVIIFGILGILIIFYYQYRHYHIQKIREEEIQRTDKLVSIGKLAAGVAHEIRNPLNAISIAIQRLQNEFIPSTQGEKDDFLNFTSVIRDEIKRVDNIITEFLNFTKKSMPAKKLVSLSKLIDDLLIVLEGEAEKNNVIFEKVFDTKYKNWVSCDPDQIKQCLINIIQNAIQAMPTGGKVTISLKSDPQEALIRISDTGPGLDSSKIDKIFEFYYSNKEGGIGLGLPISQKIIEDHGGKIEVESELGKGTHFIIHLPNRAPSESRKGLSGT